MPVATTRVAAASVRASGSASGSAMEFEIRDIRALVRRADRDAAQRLLEKIAAQVLPILTKRRFRVRRLQEFFPKNAHLLGMNVNRGVTIYIRLRPQHRPDSFLPYEALLETMLHELTHMVHGPHNQAFYKYLDELKEEMESLMLRGLAGQEGARFQDAGAGFSIQTETTAIAVRHQNDNRAAVLAAARREKYQRLLGGVTSQRLGSSFRGAGDDKTPLTAQQLRARALEAAERRRRDNQACSLTEGLANAIEILGIDDSSDDESDSTGPFAPPRGGGRVEEVITVDDDDDDDETRSATVAAENVVELLDESDDDQPGGTGGGREQDEVVDLTED